MTYDELPNSYLKLIYTAMGKIKSDYFFVAETGRRLPIARERVYCYELYHQMRCLEGAQPMEDGAVNCVINGEIDKSGHPIIKENFNPDFVIHCQGEMSKNLCVVEVKTKYNKAGVEKDFNTIKCMMHCYHYTFGVFIITGETIKTFKAKLDTGLLESIPKIVDHSEYIYIFTQKNIDSIVEVETLHKLLTN